MDLHISVIADFKSANPDIDVVDWCLSGHSHIMNRKQDVPKHIHAGSWMGLNDSMIKAFQSEYDSFLSGFDGFITGHVTAFALLYEKYNKPILSINSCRYDIPFCWSKNETMRRALNNCLGRLAAQGRLVLVSNNKADQLYTQLGCGVTPHYTPSLCLYTKAQYTPTRPTFLCYNGNLPPHPLITHKSELPTPYQWNDITSFRGVVNIPYEVSLMSAFEHFTAGCPLFFPSKAYLKANPHLQSISSYWGRGLPSEFNALSTLDKWIDLADMYDIFQSPNTYYFDSVEHLFQLIETFEYKDDRAFRAHHIQSVKDQWAVHLNRLLTNRYRTQSPAHLCYNRLPLLANVVYDCDYRNSGVRAQHTYPFHSPLEKGDVVFVKTDFLAQFLKQVQIKVPIVLVTGVSDITPSQSDCDTILRSPFIRRWIGCNIPVSHPKLTKILIGVGEPERINGNHDTLVRLHAERTPWAEKDDSVCIPYHGNTHGARTVEPTLPKLPFEDYMREIGRHKFVRCIRGNGLDTHRFSEILLMGSVPVVDHSPLDDLYSQFPCVFVDEDRSSFVWDDAKYDAFLRMFWVREGSITVCDA